MVEIALSKFRVKSKLILADSKDVISKYYKYDFWQFPQLIQKNKYKILNGLKKRKINIVIPTSDLELIFWSKNKNFFNKKNIFPMVSNLQTIKICIDKFKFYQHLIKFGITTPFTTNKYKNIPEGKYIIKERFAVNKTKAICVYNNQIKKNLKFFKNPIIQKFIKGEEYSVDCGNMKFSHVIRKRKIIYNGESEYAQVVRNKDIELITKKISSSLKYEGHHMFQGIMNKNKFYITESNARVGGMSVVSSILGFDNIAEFICSKLNLKYSKKIIKKKNFVIYRDVKYY